MNNMKWYTKIKQVLVKLSFPIFMLTVAVAMIFLYINLNRRDKEKDRKYPFIIRAENGSWRSAGPIETMDGWTFFTDDEGNLISVSGNVTVKQLKTSE